MPNGPLKALCDAIIFTGDALVEGHALLVRDGKITDIAAKGSIPADAQKISCPDRILAPGFIDAQVNGGGNVLFNNDPTASACTAIAKAHQKFGTTRLLPTIITDKHEITERAVAVSREAAKTCKNILGIHIEGPHLGIERRGVHKADYIRPATDGDMKLYCPQSSEVMLITIAPENVGPEQIKTLRSQGVIVSIGHTDATHAQIRAALNAGATGFTHLYNGMGKPSSAEPTPADAALQDQQSWCGIIMDNFHVSKELALLALKSKPQGKLFLVSDAMPPAASANPEAFQLYGETISVEAGRCVNNEGKLAGSSITMLDAVRNCVNIIGIELTEALRMASTYPANFLGLGERFGKLLPGYDADIVDLTPSLELKNAWVAGE